ncbi:MAG TPA: peptide ABC transporter substrate-binding protein [Opitutaceae bacterium]|jgi:oligopeptide transport system substrate-binding protein|nr:peptide ABC transporter substrate-binding protein [Opitutaceae bacterium]
MRPLIGAAAALLLAALTLGGCSKASNVRTGDATQVLHRSIGPDIEDLDPHMATLTANYSVLSALFEGLVAEDPVDLHPVPGVAERWDISPDGLTYTFYLRADAKWSNGEPVTAQDFVDSWHRILTPSLGATYASQLYILQGAEAFNKAQAPFSEVGVKAADPRTLMVRLEHPAPWFLSVLSGPDWFPVPIALVKKYGGVADRGNPWAGPGHWEGNGPFNLVSWHHNQEIIVARSQTYWDEAKVRLKEIHFHSFDSIDAEERAFRAEQVHLTETLPPDKVDSYRRDSPELLRMDPLLGTYFLRINVRKPGLNDARIRLALSLAIDRQAIVDKILRGGQKAALTFTPSDFAGYEPGGALQPGAEKARQLLSDAGYAGGAGLPPFELLYNTSENHKVIAESLQEMWRRELGIRVTLVNEDVKSTEAARTAGTFDMLKSSLIADYADPAAFLDTWRGDSSDNFTGWKNADYDSLLFTAARTTDPQARYALMARAEAILMGDSPVIPLYHYTHVFLARPSVHGWYPTLLDHHPYKGVWLQE